MTGIETDAVLFHGVDRGWMQAQWRDCRDKAEQLKIFRDMVGRNVPPQEILDAVGEPEYCGPMEPVKQERRRWTPEEDARIAEMVREGRSYAEIGAELDRSREAVGFRVLQLRRRGLIEPTQKKEKAVCVPEDEPEKADAETVSAKSRRHTRTEARCRLRSAICRVRTRWKRSGRRSGRCSTRRRCSAIGAASCRT